MGGDAEIETAQAVTAKGVSTTLQNDAGGTIGIHNCLDHWSEQGDVA